MFNTILPYRFVQRNRNRTEGRASWLYEDIYKFFIHSPSSRRKYLVEVHMPTPTTSTRWIFTPKSTM